MGGKWLSRSKITVTVNTSNNTNGKTEAQRDNWPKVIKSINAESIIKLRILVQPGTKVCSISHYIT